MAYTRFKRQHITQNIVPTAADKRTSQELEQDQAIGQARLLINDALNIADSFQFIGEMDAAQDRSARQAIINKWRAYADLLKATGDSSMSRHRLSKAAVEAQELGWSVTWSPYGTRIIVVRWNG